MHSFQSVASRRLFVDITPLRESRDYRLLWLSQLATSGGRQIVVVAVPYQVYLLTHSSLAVGFSTRIPHYLLGCSTSFCTRQFSNSATKSTFSAGHAIS